MYLLQVAHGQSSSMGEKSVLYTFCFIFNDPGYFMTSALPNRAVREGNTQSYISTPNAEQTTRSNANPTPIR